MYLLAARAGAAAVLAGLMVRAARQHVTVLAPSSGVVTLLSAMMGSGQCCLEANVMVSSDITLVLIDTVINCWHTASSTFINVGAYQHKG
jgi:hypothetical protein